MGQNRSTFAKLISRVTVSKYMNRQTVPGRRKFKYVIVVSEVMKL